MVMHLLQRMSSLVKKQIKEYKLIIWMNNTFSYVQFCFKLDE